MSTTARYKELVTTLRDTLYRLTLSILNNRSESEDVTQDVYERVWRARDTILEQPNPRAYICRMAHNAAIDRQRQLQRRQSISLDTRIALATDDGGEGESSDIGELTRSIIAALPEKQRMAIHLRDVEGYEIAEIGEILGMEERNVRMNLSRARKSVRAEIIKVMNYGVEGY